MCMHAQTAVRSSFEVRVAVGAAPDWHPTPSGVAREKRSRTLPHGSSFMLAVASARSLMNNRTRINAGAQESRRNTVHARQRSRPGRARRSHSHESVCTRTHTAQRRRPAGVAARRRPVGYTTRLCHHAVRCDSRATRSSNPLSELSHALAPCRPSLSLLLRSPRAPSPPGSRHGAGLAAPRTHAHPACATWSHHQWGQLIGTAAARRCRAAGCPPCPEAGSRRARAPTPPPRRTPQ